MRKRERNYKIGNESLEDPRVVRKIGTDRWFIPPDKINKRLKMIYMVNLVKKRDGVMDGLV